MTIDGQELPGAGHATQFVDAAAVLEAHARAGDQITDGAGDEDFAGRGLAENPRCDVRCDSSDVRIQRVRARRYGADLNA
jgi:hypothetical protein